MSGWFAFIYLSQILQSVSQINVFYPIFTKHLPLLEAIDPLAVGNRATAKQKRPDLRPGVF
jgi:hypothetical protein